VALSGARQIKKEQLKRHMKLPMEVWGRLKVAVFLAGPAGSCDAFLLSGTASRYPPRIVYAASFREW